MMYLDTDVCDGPEGMEKVIAVLTAGHLDSEGGYPHDWTEHAGKVFIADINHDGATDIKEYEVDIMLAWELRAQRLKKVYPEESWSFAVYESENLGTR